MRLSHRKAKFQPVQDLQGSADIPVQRWNGLASMLYQNSEQQELVDYDGCEVQECSAAGAATFIVINEVKKVEYFLRVSRASLTVSLGEGRIFLFGFFGIVQFFCWDQQN